MFTLQPSQLFTASCNFRHYYSPYLIIHGLLEISFLRLLPTWARWPFATRSNSDLPCRSSSRNTSSQEGSSSVYPRTKYVPGIFELPCPPLAHLFTPSKSAVHEVDGYQRWNPFADNPKPPIPRERIKSPALRKPPSLFSYYLGMHCLCQHCLSSFWVRCTNLIGVEQFIPFKGPV